MTSREKSDTRKVENSGQNNFLKYQIAMRKPNLQRLNLP